MYVFTNFTLTICVIKTQISFEEEIAFVVIDILSFYVRYNFCDMELSCYDEECFAKCLSNLIIFARKFNILLLDL